MALWTDEQVKNLNEYQEAGYMHPFTCGTPKCSADLVATPDGWVCPNGCGYTQNWAHDFMLNGSAVENGRKMREWIEQERKAVS